MSKPKIRLAKPEDALGIRKAQKASWLDTYAHVIPKKVIQKKIVMTKDFVGRMRKGIKDKNSHNWVALEGGKIIGFCHTQKSPIPEIKAIYLLKKAWGTGVGHRLMDRAVKWLEPNDMIVWVEENNERAIKFYKKYGFGKTRKKDVHEFHGYKMDIVMLKRRAGDVYLGNGNLRGMGVYANRDFKKGEVVIKYHLKPLTEAQFKKLTRSEKWFTHRHWGKMSLYGIPERYVNHSPNNNTVPDHKKKADVAIKAIKKGEPITTDHTKDDIG